MVCEKGAWALSVKGVSGSMKAALPLLVSCAGRCPMYIRVPPISYSVLYPYTFSSYPLFLDAYVPSF